MPAREPWYRRQQGAQLALGESWQEAMPGPHVKRVGTELSSTAQGLRAILNSRKGAGTGRMLPPLDICSPTIVLPQVSLPPPEVTIHFGNVAFLFLYHLCAHGHMITCVSHIV